MKTQMELHQNQSNSQILKLQKQLDSLQKSISDVEPLIFSAHGKTNKSNAEVCSIHLCRISSIKIFPQYQLLFLQDAFGPRASFFVYKYMYIKSWHSVDNCSRENATLCEFF